VQRLCEIAGVSTSGYYKWLRKPVHDKDEHDYKLIKEIFDKGKQKLGWRSIQMRLRSEHHIIMNHKKVKRIMKKYGLRTKIRCRNPYKAVMKKTQEHRTFPNLLQRRFTQDQPYTVFCTDITYLHYGRGRTAYLSAIKDIATGEIVSWELSESLALAFVLKSAQRLEQVAGLHPEAMIHSDQGVHYTNPEYIALIQALGLRQSMSRKGNCIDNAPIESFFGHFKDDVEYKHLYTYTDLRITVAQYIEYYNHQRYQWNKKKMTPVQYRNHLFISI
jgi:transposase InsO family protein